MDKPKNKMEFLQLFVDALLVNLAFSICLLDR